MTIIIAIIVLYLLVTSAEVRGLVAIIVVCAAIAGYVNVNHTGEQRVATLPEVIELGQVKHIITMEAPPPEEPDEPVIEE